MKKLIYWIKRLVQHTTTITIWWCVSTVSVILLVAMLLGSLEESYLAKATFIVVFTQILLLALYELSLQKKVHKPKTQYIIAKYKVAIFALSFVATAIVALSEPMQLDANLIVACIAALISADRVVTNNEKVLKLKESLLESGKE